MLLVDGVAVCSPDPEPLPQPCAEDLISGEVCIPQPVLNPRQTVVFVFTVKLDSNLGSAERFSYALTRGTTGKGQEYGITSLQIVVMQGDQQGSFIVSPGVRSFHVQLEIEGSKALTGQETLVMQIDDQSSDDLTLAGLDACDPPAEIEFQIDPNSRCLAQGVSEEK